METVEITIVIPNYNNSKYLNRAVESAINQTYPIREIIIVDDASTDNSRDVIEKICSEYQNVNYIFLDSNAGVSNARNVGLAATCTEYITFLDADDYYYSTEKIKYEVQTLESIKKEGKDPLVYSITVFGDNSGNRKNSIINIWTPKWHFMQGNAFYRLISASFLERVPRDYLIKTDILRSVGAYNTNMNLYEDYDLLLRISKKGTPFYCSYSYGTLYRESEGGLSKQKENVLENTLANICHSYYENLTFVERIKVYYIKIMWFFLEGIIKIPGKIKRILLLLTKS